MSACVARVHQPVLLVLDPVAVGLTVLGEQDQRRGVGRLRREREVQEDERVRVPLAAATPMTLRRIQTMTTTVWMTRKRAVPSVRAMALGEVAEGLRVVVHSEGRTLTRRRQVLPPLHPAVSRIRCRHPAGSDRSSTSSTVTVPSSCRSASHTATETRL